MNERPYIINNNYLGYCAEACNLFFLFQIIFVVKYTKLNKFFESGYYLNLMDFQRLNIISL